ncbi:MAG TPA: thioredoxin family protein [Acetobacteraceae bacterium]|nr:thioredoxin family protein [Acetobacteraceae bacterium]
MEQHRIVSREEWLAARKALLAREKAWTHMRDALAEERQALPWVRVDKTYVFEGSDGPVSLADLFDGRSQLIVYHFMFGPDWKEGCVGCSFLADHVDAARQHFEQNDLGFVAVSRAPFARLDAFRRRMGWCFRWVSSGKSDFNFDFNVSFPPERKMDGKVFYNFEMIDDPEIEELPGTSVFCKDQAGAIFHTYSHYARGGELQLGAYAYLDLAPKGRNEVGRGNLGDWVRHHDRYGAGGHVDPTGRYHEKAEAAPCHEAPCHEASAKT